MLTPEYIDRAPDELVELYAKPKMISCGIWRSA